MSKVSETKRKVGLKKLQNIGLRAKKQGKKLKARRANDARSLILDDMDRKHIFSGGTFKRGKK